MARTAKLNPVVVGGTPLKVVTRRATDAKTWKAGEFGTYAAAGTVEPVATDAVNVKLVLLEDQDTSTSSTDVKVGLISADTEFEGYTSTDDADVAATVAAAGNDYGIQVGSNYHTVNLNETSNVAVLVTDYRANYSPLTDTSSTSPGRVKFVIKSAVLQA